MSNLVPKLNIYLSIFEFLLFFLSLIVTQNPLHTENLPPWNHGTMVRSNIWFDTLQKTLKNSDSSFVNPMLTSFHSIVEDADGLEICKSGRHSAAPTDEFQSTTEKTSLESFDSINDDDPPFYENFPASKRMGIQRSKSMQFLQGNKTDIMPFNLKISSPKYGYYYFFCV